MKKFFLIFVFTIFSYASTILVAASANTMYVMPEIIKAFNKKYPKINVRTVLASSGKLTAQIMHGAKYDVFLSANMKYPEFLYKYKKSITKPKIYAKGAIVLFSVKHINLQNYKKALINCNSLAIANPKTAPYGKASVEFLKNIKIYNRIKNKLIYAESVSQVVAYTLNAADIGIIAKSILFSPKMKRFKNYIDIPQNLYSPINQGIILLNNKNESKKFYDFIFSDEAKKIFSKYGYIIK